MATITAIQNGNWSDASTWDLNRIPDVDDDVDFSNYVVNNLPSAITVKTITNNLGYGKITANAQNINANIVSGQGVEVFQCNQTSRTIYISGNVSGSVLRTNNDNYVASHVQNLNITGNVVLNNNDIVWNWVGTGSFYYNYWTLNITGNVVCNGTSKIINVDRNYGITLTINGNTILNDFSTVGVLMGGLRNLLVTFNGNLFINNEFGTVSYIASGKLNINGELEIVNSISNTKQFGTINIGYIIKYHNKQRINSLYVADIVNLTNNFKCIYMGEGEPLGYFISQEELHTSQQYPPEDEVKQGTEYVWGQKVGTYTPDYPPESVVLKDYEYGDSDDRKTGTMPVLSQQLISRLENCATVETVQQLLVAHLDN